MAVLALGLKFIIGALASSENLIQKSVHVLFCLDLTKCLYEVTIWISFDVSIASLSGLLGWFGRRHFGDIRRRFISQLEQNPRCHLGQNSRYFSVTCALRNRIQNKKSGRKFLTFSVFAETEGFFEKTEGLIEALRDGEVSGLTVEDGMDDRFELFELSLEVGLHLLRGALCAHQKTTFQ